MSIGPPSPFAPDDDWQRWNGARRGAAPGWGYCRDYVTSHALDRLPAICAALGTGEAVAITPRTKWWAGVGLADGQRRMHGLDMAGSVLALRLTPGSYDLLFIDRATGEWECPNVSRRGSDLVALGSWRWAIGEAKAAWRLARLCGLRRPMP